MVTKHMWVFSVKSCNSNNLVTYSRTSSNAQPIQKISIFRDLELLQNTGVCADDNVARATKKARVMLLLPEAILRDPNPQYFLPPV